MRYSSHSQMSNRPVRILHTIRTLDSAAGGPVEAVTRLAEMGASLGFQTTIACCDPKSRLPRIPGANIVSLGAGIGTYGFTRKAGERLRELIKKHDAVVVRGLWQYHGLAARMACFARRPYVVFPHGMLDPWFNRMYRMKAIKKRLYWPLGDYRVLRDAAAVCFTSETERNLARTSFRPYCAREIVLSYGTAAPRDDNQLAQRAEFLAHCPGVKDRPYLLFLGRIHEKKGCDLLIEAFADIANIHSSLQLVVAGPDQGALVPQLKARAVHLGIAHRIHWPGMLVHQLKWGALRGASAFCLPSHQENFGIAVAEALACGIPVLISDQVNIWREIVADGAGMVGPDSLLGTKDLLLRWINLSDESQRAMSRCASNCFRNRFSIDQAAADLLRVVQTIIVNPYAYPAWSP